MTECSWLPWGTWQECTRICDASLRTRIRQCSGCVPGRGGCQGEGHQYK